jgi:hypothetical protein
MHKMKKRKVKKKISMMRQPEKAKKKECM